MTRMMSRLSTAGNNTSRKYRGITADQGDLQTHCQREASECLKRRHIGTVLRDPVLKSKFPCSRRLKQHDSAPRFRRGKRTALLFDHQTTVCAQLTLKFMYEVGVGAIGGLSKRQSGLFSSDKEVYVRLHGGGFRPTLPRAERFRFDMTMIMTGRPAHRMEGAPL